MVSSARLAALSAVYQECEQLARKHPEPLRHRCLPRHLRPHVAAIYTFARTADDFADEPGRDAVERLQLLDEWSRMLHATDSLASLEFVPQARSEAALQRRSLPRWGTRDGSSIYRSISSNIY